MTSLDLRPSLMALGQVCFKSAGLQSLTDTTLIAAHVNAFIESGFDDYVLPAVIFRTLAKFVVSQAVVVCSPGKYKFKIDDDQGAVTVIANTVTDELLFSIGDCQGDEVVPNTYARATTFSPDEIHADVAAFIGSTGTHGGMCTPSPHTALDPPAEVVTIGNRFDAINRLDDEAYCRALLETAETFRIKRAKRNAEQIAYFDQAMKAKDYLMFELEAAILERDLIIIEKDRLLVEKDCLLVEKDRLLSENEEMRKLIFGIVQPPS